MRSMKNHSLAHCTTMRTTMHLRSSYAYKVRTLRMYSAI